MSGLKPEPVPVDIKVILVGNNLLFQLLHQLDEDFGKLFEVKVDFDDEMEANDQNLLSLAKNLSVDTAAGKNTAFQQGCCVKRG